MTLPAVGHSVRLARYATHAVLTAWQLAHMEEAAALLVSELVTNAVRHAKGTDVVELDLHARRTWLLIEIQDFDRNWPQPRIPDGFDESGFGFILVEALAAAGECARPKQAKPYGRNWTPARIGPGI